MTKTKLTDSQLVILNIAIKAECPIGKDDLTGLRAKGTALTRVIAGLIKKDLLKEVRVKPGAPFWKRNENGQVKALAITTEGLAALGIDTKTKATTPQPSTKKLRRRVRGKQANPDSAATPAPRAKTKKAQLLGLLLSAEGANIDQLAKKFSWQPHTVRAALTGLRKSGYEIERSAGDGVSCYRIVGQRKAA